MAGPYTSPDSKAVVDELSKTLSELHATKAENKQLRCRDRFDRTKIWSRRVGRLLLLAIVLQLVFNVYDRGWLACTPSPVRRIELGRLYAGDAAWTRENAPIYQTRRYEEVCLDQETTLHVAVDLPENRGYRVHVYHRGARQPLTVLSGDGPVRVPPGCTRFLVEHTSSCDNGAAYSIRVTEVLGASPVGAVVDNDG